MNTPKKGNEIDVVIPVYNGQKYILEALQSVVNQNYKPHMIIVVDDGSTDTTPQLLHNFICPIPLQIIRQENHGLSSARNSGLRASSSDFIAFLDADDVWYPTKLERQINIFQTTNFAHLGAVYCQYEIIDETGATRKDAYIFRIDPKIRGDVFRAILPMNKIASSASGILVKRECFEKAGQFDERLTATEDWDLWLRIAQHYEFDFADETLVKIRRHNQNMQNNDEHMFVNRLTFYDKWIGHLPEMTQIPRLWMKTLILSILQRLPRKDFWSLFQRNTSKTSKAKIRKFIYQELKWFTLMRLCLSPLYIAQNLIRNCRKSYE